MQHYQKITKWKTKAGKKCKNCRKQINTSDNYFVLTAYWKIKRKPDEHYFCSLKCLRQWAKED